jgi:L-ascorbate metabolism protein UlaG (beta-lactamase superfamily)
VLLALALSFHGAEAKPAPDKISTAGGDLVVQPLNHATLALQHKTATIFVDPVGGKSRFEGLPDPDFILITDIHQDHLNGDTLLAVTKPKTQIIVPLAVQPLLPQNLKSQATVLTNGQIQVFEGIKIEAIAAYNLAEERQKFHPKGRGNGYVITLGGKRVYLSGDTEDIPEVKQLKDIDVAFVCMNLPYTMTVEQAAGLVAAFKPKVVYPYHSRGSDLKKFEALLKDKPGIEVRIRDWYQD